LVKQDSKKQLDYTVDVQKLFLRMMITNAELYTRVMNIMNSENFDRVLRPVAELFKEHTDKYKILPDSTQIKAVTGIDIETVPEITEGHYEWFFDEFEAFTKRQELERAILKSADLLEKGDFSPVEKLIKDAVQISLQKDMGTDYFYDPATRINKYFNSGGQVSTGWPQMDAILYGGMSRGELNIFAGGSGSGKSLVMMNLALNWLQVGLSGVYITLELSEELTSLRTDAMLTSMGTKEIRKDIEQATLKVMMAGKKAGKYRVKGLPAQSNVNDIRAYLKEVQIQTGIKVDFVMVDYLDLVMPVSVKVSPNDLFVKDKYVSEELRNLAKELNVLFVTASQLNRSAVEEIEFDHSHISGGISKINTADNVFGIFTSRSMRERGKYQIQCMKSRSSTGVGKKIDLEYNIETMRITDEGGDGANSYNPQPSSNDIMNRLKPSSNVTPVGDGIYIEDSDKKVVADVQGSKLKSLLNNLKK
jgi:KaiC/GvpD/RAD55 family RecA-like ATPase|tara:strand:+ start:107 stop:1534 length:1428 start_codon:yes stop_codon:yes gene_type:complete